MCGRFAFALSNEELYDGLQNQLPRMLERGRPRWEREPDYRPGNYNVAPRQRMPIVHRDPEDSDRAIIHTAQWGLIPHWTKHPPTTPLNTINARSEALLEPGSGGMWHALKGYKRCIVPVQGYYEWQKKPSSKIAHFTRLPVPSSSDKTTLAPLMFLAGLYDTVKYASPVESHFKPSGPDDTREPYPTGNPVPLTTFTILTTSPPKDFMWLHDRMPCILTEWEAVVRWLDLGEVKGWEEGKGGTGDLLKGMSGLESYPVPPEVGKVGINSPTFIQPVSERADGIKSFFQKQSPAKPKPAVSTDAKKTSTEGTEAREPDTLRKEVKEEYTEVEGEIVKKEEPVTVIEQDDKEQGLGDDSNAPNPDTGRDEKPALKDEKPTPGKRNRPDVEPAAIEPGDEEEEDKPKQKQKRAGHQIEVIRKKEDDKKPQKTIENFFGSPKATKAPPLVGKTSTRATRSKTRPSAKQAKS